MHFLESVLNLIVNYALLFFEFAGVLIIAFSGIRGFIGWVTRRPTVRLQLAQGMALGLEFKLGSEILRTVIVREISEVAFVAAIIAVRAALTFLIHWEIKEEEKAHEAAKHQERTEGEVINNGDC